MATLTIRMPDNKADRLKALAAQRKISVNKLIDELATYAIAEFDSETRFRVRAARGSAKRGKQLLGELDRYYASAPESASCSLHDNQEQGYELPAENADKKKK